VPRARVSRTVAVLLVVLGAATFLRGVAWASALPAWQGPDEVAHYAYVERLAAGVLPPLEPPAWRDSPAVSASLEATAVSRFAFRDAGRPLSSDLRAALPAEAPGLSERGEGAHGASTYPPTYYLLALPLYSMPGLETATQRLFATRLLSAILAAALAVVTALLVLETTRREGLALAAGVLVSLPPMIGQASGILNPDILLALGVAGLAWAAVRLRRGVTATRLLHLAAWTLLASTAKPVGAPLVVCVAAAFAAVPAALRSRRVAAALVAALASGGVALTVLALVGGTRVRAPYEFGARYLLDFYRPRLPGLTGDSSPSRAWSVWVESGIGSLGPFTVWLPSWTYALALTALLAAGGGAIFGLSRDRRHLPFAASCAAAVGLYVAVLHVAELDLLLKDLGSLLQGRYLTAVAPLGVAAFAAGAAALPRRAAHVLFVIVLAVWALVALVALDAVVAYFAS
jgi:4-amino-4-deoxy-L-arabinose transferase-like glycosyltransferase